MKILVTGGAGYIGTTLVPLLLERGHAVTVLDALLFGIEPILPMFRHPRFSFARVDVRDRASLAEHVRRADAFVHLAAIVGYPGVRTQSRRSPLDQRRGNPLPSRRRRTRPAAGVCLDRQLLRRGARRDLHRGHPAAAAKPLRTDEGGSRDPAARSVRRRRPADWPRPTASRPGCVWIF